MRQEFWAGLNWRGAKGYGARQATGEVRAKLPNSLAVADDRLPLKEMKITRSSRKMAGSASALPAG